MSRVSHDLFKNEDLTECGIPVKRRKVDSSLQNNFFTSLYDDVASDEQKDSIQELTPSTACTTTSIGLLEDLCATDVSENFESAICQTELDDLFNTYGIVEGEDFSQCDRTIRDNAAFLGDAISLFEPPTTQLEVAQSGSLIVSSGFQATEELDDTTWKKPLHAFTKDFERTKLMRKVSQIVEYVKRRRIKKCCTSESQLTDVCTQISGGSGGGLASLEDESLRANLERRCQSPEELEIKVAILEKADLSVALAKIDVFVGLFLCRVSRRKDLEPVYRLVSQSIQPWCGPREDDDALIASKLESSNEENVCTSCGSSYLELDYCAMAMVCCLCGNVVESQTSADANATIETEFVNGRRLVKHGVHRRPYHSGDVAKEIRQNRFESFCRNLCKRVSNMNHGDTGMVFELEEGSTNYSVMRFCKAFYVTDCTLMEARAGLNTNRLGSIVYNIALIVGVVDIPLLQSSILIEEALRLLAVKLKGEEVSCYKGADADEIAYLLNAEMCNEYLETEVGAANNNAIAKHEVRSYQSDFMDELFACEESSVPSDGLGILNFSDTYHKESKAVERQIEAKSDNNILAKGVDLISVNVKAADPDSAAVKGCIDNVENQIVVEGLFDALLAEENTARKSESLDGLIAALEKTPLVTQKTFHSDRLLTDTIALKGACSFVKNSNLLNPTQNPIDKICGLIVRNRSCDKSKILGILTEKKFQAIANVTRHLLTVYLTHFKPVQSPSPKDWEKSGCSKSKITSYETLCLEGSPEAASIRNIHSHKLVEMKVEPVRGNLMAVICASFSCAAMYHKVNLTDASLAEALRVRQASIAQNRIKILLVLTDILKTCGLLDERLESKKKKKARDPTGMSKVKSKLIVDLIEQNFDFIMTA